MFSSSATVYGEPESMPLIEKMNMDAQSCYGRTKEHIEDMLVDLAASDSAGTSLCCVTQPCWCARVRRG